MMASFMRIPTLVMDSNALPGFTNRRLAPFVDKAALTFEEAMSYFGKKGVVTGNPVRKEFFDLKPRTPNGKVNLLIFGGSQGARAINNAMIQALADARAGEGSAKHHLTKPARRISKRFGAHTPTRVGRADVGRIFRIWSRYLAKAISLSAGRAQRLVPNWPRRAKHR